MWMAILSSREGNEDRVVTTALLEEGKPNGKEKSQGAKASMLTRAEMENAASRCGCLVLSRPVQEYKEMALSRDSAPGDKLAGRGPTGGGSVDTFPDYISHPRARLPDLTWSKRPPVKDGMWGGGGGLLPGDRRTAKEDALL